jgi:dihydrodipicolinate synthase/N-acetylneuraminate lyase
MLNQTAVPRRLFLSSVVGAGLANNLLAGGPRSRSRLTPQEFKEKLDGPIQSIATVYTSDFRIDRDGIRRMVDTGIRSGAKVFGLTAGDSQYDFETYEEIKQLTRMVVEAVAGRGMTIAATGGWWTGQVVDYARFADECGADAVQIKLPAGDEDSLYEYFRQVAASTPLAIVLHGETPMPLLKRLMEIDSIVAYKEEYPPTYTIDVFAHYGKRLNIFGGGQKSRFLMYQPYGMHAYYEAFTTFAPSVPRQFWSAVQRGDLEGARQLMFRYDVPFFERWSHPFWRATLEHFGVAKRFLRPPNKTFTDEQMKDVAAFYRELGLS